MKVGLSSNRNNYNAVITFQAGLYRLYFSSLKKTLNQQIGLHKRSYEISQTINSRIMLLSSRRDLRGGF